MAKGRFISQTIAKDKRLNQLSMEAELLYLMTIPHLDRDGLILGEPLVLWGTVCPRRPELMTSIETLISEWLEAGLILRYLADDDPILYFTGFNKNQQLRYDRETPSQYDPPPGYIRTDAGLVPDELRTAATPVPDELRSSAGHTPEPCRSRSRPSTSRSSRSSL